MTENSKWENLTTYEEIKARREEYDDLVWRYDALDEEQLLRVERKVVRQTWVDGLIVGLTFGRVRRPSPRDRLLAELRRVTPPVAQFGPLG